MEAETMSPEWSKSTLKISVKRVAVAFITVRLFPKASSSRWMAVSL
jgi:hypothetical protein